MAKEPVTTREPITAKPVTDEQLLAITASNSQEFADLAIADKLRWYQLDNQRLHQAKETLEKKQKGYGLHVSIKDGVMTVTIPVKEKLEASSTGKTLSVASTHGNIKTECMVNGKPLTIGLNAYIPA